MARSSIGWLRLGLRVGFGLGVALAVLVGCAVGSEVDATLESDFTNLSGDAGTGTDSSVPLPPPSVPAADSGATADAGADASLGSDAGADAGPVAGSCTSPTVCGGAVSFGSVSGDTGSDVRNTQGSMSAWFTMRVSEDEHSFFGVELSMRAELVSPPGANFDLYLYVAGGETGQECSAIAQASTNAGSPDSARVAWGESAIANGAEDARTVTIEVRHVSGTCSAGAKWALTVVGNAP